MIKSVYKWRHLQNLSFFFFFFLMVLPLEWLFHGHHWSTRAYESSDCWQEGAHLWITRLWQNTAIICASCKSSASAAHMNAWWWSLHPPVLLSQRLSKSSEGKRVLQGSRSRSISELERRSCWTRANADLTVRCINALWERSRIKRISAFGHRLSAD